MPEQKYLVGRKRKKIPPPPIRVRRKGAASVGKRTNRTWLVMEDKLDCPVYTQEDYQLVSTFIETSQRGKISKLLAATSKKKLTFENPLIGRYLECN